MLTRLVISLALAAALPAVGAESLSRQAWQMRHRGEPASKFIPVQVKAVEQVRQGLSPDDAVEVLEQLGFFYNIEGDYASALRYYNEAVDSLRRRPLSARGAGAIQLFGDVSSLYGVLGMLPEAIAWSDSAVVESRRQGGRMLCDVYRFRAGVYQANNDDAEALRCYDLALRAVNEGPTAADKDYLRALVGWEKAGLIIESGTASRDSILQAVRVIEEGLRYDDQDDAYRRFSLAQGYMALGETARAVDSLRAVAADFERQGDAEMLFYARRALADAYAALGRGDELAALWPRYKAAADSFLTDQKRTEAVMAMARNEIADAARQTELLELRLARRRDANVILWCVIGLLACVAVGVVAVLRRLYLRAKRRGETLSGRVETLEQGMSAEINSDSDILARPQLLTSEAEGRFRRAFVTLHPDFVDAIRQRGSRLTPGDELLCMLIRLGRTTDEIAASLAIARPSVNSARYRLRSKFALDRDADLDIFICSL